MSTPKSIYLCPRDRIKQNYAWLAGKPQTWFSFSLGFRFLIYYMKRLDWIMIYKIISSFGILWYFECNPSLWICWGNFFLPLWNESRLVFPLSHHPPKVLCLSLLAKLVRRYSICALWFWRRLSKFPNRNIIF